jgi:hypothetical protein
MGTVKKSLGALALAVAMQPLYQESLEGRQPRVMSLKQNIWGRFTRALSWAPSLVNARTRPTTWVLSSMSVKVTVQRRTAQPPVVLCSP